MSDSCSRFSRSRRALSTAAFGSWAIILAADGVAARPVAVDLPAGNLREALNILSRQARISVGAAGPMPQLRTPRVKGMMEPGAALDALLAGTSWRGRLAAPDTWQVERRPPPRIEAVRPPVEVFVEPPVTTIVVTATKRAERLANVPVSIGVISGATFAGTSPARNSSDLAGQVEGAFSTNLGPGSNRIFLRGVADSPFNGPTQSTVGLFLDDVRINYAMPDPDLRLVDIDRVEVLRGPQGTLYGTGSLGGIVRIVTRRPELDGWSGTSATDVTTVAHGNHGGAFEGTVNAPIIEGQLALRAVAYADTVPGWIDDAKRGKTNVNRVNRTGGRADLRWQTGPSWTFDLSATIQNLHGHDSQYATTHLDRETAFNELHRNYIRIGRIEARGAIAGFDVLSTTAIEANQVFSRFDASAVAESRGLSGPLAYDEARSLVLLSHEMRISDPDARRPWVAGMSLLLASNRTDGSFVPEDGASLQVRDQYNHSFEGALFGEATQPFGRKFDLTLGMRLFTSTNYDQIAVEANNTGKETGVTPSATLAWRPSRGKLVWLRYAKAVRPGGLSTDSTGETAAFQSDELQSLELGTRLKLLDGRLFFTGAAFALSWRNLQSDVIGTDGLVVTINGGNATNYGAELGATLKLGAVSLDGGTTVQFGRLTSDNLLGGNDRRLPILPDFSGRLRVSYAQEVRGFATNSYVGAAYSGTARLSFDPTLDNSLSGHMTVNAGVSVARGRWRTTLSISNLIDNSSDTFSFGNPFTIRMIDQHTPYQPRTVGLRFERRF